MRFKEVTETLIFQFGQRPISDNMLTKHLFLTCKAVLEKPLGNYLYYLYHFSAVGLFLPACAIPCLYLAESSLSKNVLRNCLNML